MNRIRYIFLFILLANIWLFVPGCVSVSGSVMTECGSDEMFSNAMTLYADGDVASAAYQMALYLQINQSDTDAMRLLVTWYTELGEKAYAEKYIKMIGEHTEISAEADLILSGEKDSKLITQLVSDVRVSIQPMAVRSEQVVLTVTGKNLFSGNYERDCYLGTESAGWRTSEWFSVDDGMGALTISGGFNRAVWQFEFLDGEHILAGDDSKTYRVSNSNLMKNLTSATVEIPENAVRCRIAYAFEPDDTSDTLEERVQIEYGTFPSDYETFRHEEIRVPDMDEDSAVVYEKGKWKIIKGGSESFLDLDKFELKKGDTVSVSASLSSIVTIDIEEAAVNTAGIYGVTWSNDSTSILLERTDDAAGLSFNYLSGDGWAGPYANDFDNIYPWSDIKLCAIDESGSILYEDEPGFAADGSAGNVFVEIPKHYVKREVINGKEYIAISAVPRDGFVLDPSFQREAGEIDHIYIAAYLTSFSSDKMESVSGGIPATNYSFAELEKSSADLTEHSIGKYSEIDFFAVMTLQRLFLVETGVRNSQVFWQGETSKAYLSKTAPQQYAVNDDSAGNTIVVVDSSLNRRFRKGDAVCICTYEQFFGGRKYDNYYTRLVTDVKFIKDSIYIGFDGEPLEIISGKTQIAHVSDINGKTDSLPYHSGSTGENDGLTPFRYRYIENMWGNGFVCVEGVEVTNKTIRVVYPDGHETILSYDLGLQQMSPGQTDVDYGIMNISSFGFDEDNPLIMMPDAAGCSVSTSFGDTLYTGFADGWEARAVRLLWGGTWDLRTSCGLFCYRFLAADTDNFRENVSRMMFCF